MSTIGYEWRLREVMAERGMWKTTELTPLLEARGVTLSSTQVFRLVTQRPERLSLVVLAAICDGLGCSPNDLIVPTAQSRPLRRAAGEVLGDVTHLRQHVRPRPARVDPGS